MIPERGFTGAVVGSVAKEANLGFGKGLERTRPADGQVMLRPEYRVGKSIPSEQKRSDQEKRPGDRGKRHHQPAPALWQFQIRPGHVLGLTWMGEVEFQFFFHEGPTYLRICNR